MWSQLRSGERDRREDDRDQQQRLADQQADPDDHRADDGEAGEEDRQDRARAGRAEVDGAESGGEYGDLVAHLVHVGAGGVDDADAELVGDLERGREQREGDEGSEDRLREPERGSGQRGWFAADHAADDLEHEEAEHHEDADAEHDVVDLRVLAAGHVDVRRGVDDLPDGREHPLGRAAHALSEPVERRGHDRAGRVAGGVADLVDHRHIADTHD